MPVGFAADEPIEVDIWWLTDFVYEEGGEIPARIRQLNGEDIILSGYMHQFPDSETEKFLVVDDGCVCGGRPLVNRFVEVTLDGEKTDFRPGLIDVRGVLDIGEELDEDGFVVSLFRLEGEFY